MITFILSLLLLCSREKKRSIYREDEEDCKLNLVLFCSKEMHFYVFVVSYLSIGQWNESSESHRHDNRSRSRHSKILI